MHVNNDYIDLLVFLFVSILYVLFNIIPGHARTFKALSPKKIHPVTVTVTGGPGRDANPLCKSGERDPHTISSTERPL